MFLKCPFVFVELNYKFYHEEWAQSLTIVSAGSKMYPMIVVCMKSFFNFLNKRIMDLDTRDPFKVECGM